MDSGLLNGQTKPGPLVTAALTSVTLFSFAANSVLCRLALAGGAIEPSTFTSLRIASGAVTLWGISAFLRRKSRPQGSWISATALAFYAVAFSFAYVSLSAGTGALILFGAVQATMITGGLHGGERPHVWQWMGLVLAIGGLVYLVFPGLKAPSLSGSALMTLAGVSWGIYSLRGRRNTDPITATTDNFIRAVPVALAVSLFHLPSIHWSAHGVILAVFSGAITSGIGYIFWFAALRGLTATRAAIVQLAVPVIAAIGGVIFLSEEVTARLLIASLVILGGVGIAIRLWHRSDRARSQTS